MLITVLGEKEKAYKLQIADLKGEIDDLTVYKNLILNLQSGRTIVRFITLEVIRIGRTSNGKASSTTNSEHLTRPSI